jgi:hypothetical protein
LPLNHLTSFGINLTGYKESDEHIDDVLTVIASKPSITQLNVCGSPIYEVILKLLRCIPSIRVSSSPTDNHEYGNGNGKNGCQVKVLDLQGIVNDPRCYIPLKWHRIIDRSEYSSIQRHLEQLRTSVVI